jgi:hypothetical protein
MTIVGSGSYRYEVMETWASLPTGWTFGPVSAVATDSQDRVYAFQRKDPPILVFDKNGTYLNSWGSSAFADPHGINIVNDVIYVTDRDDHVALKFTLDGKPLMVLGTRGQASDTGATKDIELPPRSAGPFNKPTEMMVAPSGDLYVSDGYRNSRVHRFSSQGALLDSWGKPGKQEPGDVSPAPQPVGGQTRTGLRVRPREQSHPGLHRAGPVHLPVARHPQTHGHLLRRSGDRLRQ